MNLGIKRVLLNHPDQSRWTRREVFQTASGLGAEHFIKVGKRNVVAYRLYTDPLSGKQRASGKFIVMERA